MPYNGSGSFSVENTFVPNTPISSSQVNANFTDIATNGLSAVLTRDGQSSMTGQFKAANGTPASPSITFGSDTNLGRYRKSSDVMVDVCGGTEVVEISADGIAVSGDVEAETVDAETIKQAGASLLPAGVILPYGGSSAPTGYLLCYGQAISRTTYAALFAAISTTFGTGDGSTTFNVPDLRGRVAAGKDNMGGSAASRLTATTMSPNGNTLGATGGAEGISLTSAQLASHSHTASVTDAGHSHVSFFDGTASSIVSASNYPALSADFGSDFSYAMRASSTTASVGKTSTATTGISVSNSSTGSGTAHNNVQPSLLTNYIIKT